MLSTVLFPGAHTMSTTGITHAGLATGSMAYGICAVVLPVVVALAANTVIFRWFPWLINSTRDLAMLRIGPRRRPGERNDRLATRPSRLSARGAPSPGITWLVGGTGLVLAWIVGLALPGAMTGGWADMPLLVGLGLVAGATGWLAWIDRVVHRLPNRIVISLDLLMVLCLVAALLTAIATSNGLPAFWQSWALLLGHAGACGLALTAFFACVAALGAVLGHEAMGMGDVKLAFPLGVTAGLFTPWGVLIALLVMNVSALIELGVAWAVTKRRPAGRLPYGPHMLIGTWTAVLITAALL